MQWNSKKYSTKVFHFFREEIYVCLEKPALYNSLNSHNMVRKETAVSDLVRGEEA